MLEIKDIENLAKLARIELTDSEKNKLLKDVDSILDYVTQIKEVSADIKSTLSTGEHRNITRDDVNPTETGKNTADIVKEFPEKDKDYLKVKKIL